MKHSFYLLLGLFTFLACNKEPYVTGQGIVSAEILWNEKHPDKVGYGDRTTFSQEASSIFYIRIFGGPNAVVTCRDALTGKINYTRQDPIDIYDGEKINLLQSYKNALIVGSAMT